MKSNLKVALVAFASIALSLSGLTAAQATSYSVSVSPTENLKSGDTVTLTVSGLSGALGVYASLCKAGETMMDLPTICDEATNAWITGTGAMGSSVSPVQMTLSATFTDGADEVDCTVDDCVIYVRGDHNNMGDFSLIRAPQLFFVAGGAVRLVDSATATYGSTTLLPNQPGNLSYRMPITLNVVAGSGLPATLTSLTPDCTVNGNVVTALKGTGVCAIGATTAGDTNYRPLNVNFPFYLNKTTPTLTANWPSLKKVVKGQQIKLWRKWYATSLDQEVQVKSLTKSVCTIKNTAKSFQLTFKAVGTCTLQATAWGNATNLNTVKSFVTYSVSRY